MAGEKVVVYEHPELHEPGFVRSRCTVTSVKVEEAGGHDHVTIWNRGGCAGSLVVDGGDGARIARLLLPGAREVAG